LPALRAVGPAPPAAASAALGARWKGAPIERFAAADERTTPVRLVENGTELFVVGEREAFEHVSVRFAERDGTLAHDDATGAPARRSLECRANLAAEGHGSTMANAQGQAKFLATSHR
jgi:hypothetical protein